MQCSLSEISGFLPPKNPVPKNPRRSFIPGDHQPQSRAEQCGWIFLPKGSSSKTEAGGRSKGLWRGATVQGEQLSKGGRGA